MCLERIKLLSDRFIETWFTQVLDSLRMFSSDLLQAVIKFRFHSKKIFEIATIQAKQLTYFQGDDRLCSTLIRIDETSFAKVIAIVQMTYLQNANSLLHRYSIDET